MMEEVSSCLPSYDFKSVCVRVRVRVCVCVWKNVDFTGFLGPNRPATIFTVDSNLLV